MWILATCYLYFSFLSFKGQRHQRVGSYTKLCWGFTVNHNYCGKALPSHLDKCATVLRQALLASGIISRRVCAQLYPLTPSIYNSGVLGPTTASWSLLFPLLLLSCLQCLGVSCTFLFFLPHFQSTETTLPPILECSRPFSSLFLGMVCFPSHFSWFKLGFRLKAGLLLICVCR